MKQRKVREVSLLFNYHYINKMIKTIIITVLLAFAYTIGFTQTREEIADLQQQLAIAKDDTSRVNVLIDLCYVYR